MSTPLSSGRRNKMYANRSYEQHRDFYYFDCTQVSLDSVSQVLAIMHICWTSVHIYGVCAYHFSFLTKIGNWWSNRLLVVKCEWPPEPSGSVDESDECAPLLPRIGWYILELIVHGIETIKTLISPFRKPGGISYDASVINAWHMRWWRFIPWLAENLNIVLWFLKNPEWIESIDFLRNQRCYFLSCAYNAVLDFARLHLSELCLLPLVFESLYRIRTRREEGKFRYVISSLAKG